MAGPIDIDDPGNVSKFLSIIRGNFQAPPRADAIEDELEAAQSTSIKGVSDTKLAPDSAHTQIQVQSVAIEVPVEYSAEPSAGTTPDLAGSPVNWPGIHPPPSTPATHATLQTQITNLESLTGANDLDTIEEDSNEPEPTPDDKLAAFVTHASNSKEGLMNSKHAPRNPVRPMRQAGHLLENPLPGQPGFATATEQGKSQTKPSQYPPNAELLERMKSLGSAYASSYQDGVVAKFRREHVQDARETKVGLGDGLVGLTAIAEAAVNAQGSNTERSKMVKVEGGASDVEEPATNADVQTVEKAIALKLNADVAAFEPKATTASHDEDREHQTYFSSWGSASPRDTPKARVRSVILTNLPASSDATLVSSLIHGGSIEALKLNKPANGVIANAKVIFTDGDAADTYYDKYPNGLDFRYQGKRYTAFVNKGQDVDVISGLMRGYLESGATRVVRAVGAEEDWGILALNKIASGNRRQVETVVDIYRGEVSDASTTRAFDGPDIDRFARSSFDSRIFLMRSSSRVSWFEMSTGRCVAFSSWKTRARRRQVCTWRVIELPELSRFDESRRMVPQHCTDDQNWFYY